MSEGQSMLKRWNNVFTIYVLHISDICHCTYTREIELSAWQRN